MVVEVSTWFVHNTRFHRVNATQGIGAGDAWWPYRICVLNYPLIRDKLHDLKVMLVFARYNHVQAALTKPHIRQAWDGFRMGAHLWVRMNPDRAYMQSMDPGYGSAFPDNPDNRQPGDWRYIEDWGFPTDHKIRGDVWLALVAEMADRVQMNDWSDDLDEAFFPVLTEDDSGMESAATLPDRFRLLPNYPNPFNSTTTILLDLIRPCPVSLKVFDAQGRRTAILAETLYPAEFHHIRWIGGDLPSGVYVIR